MLKTKIQISRVLQQADVFHSFCFFMTLFVKEQEERFLLLFLDTNMIKRLVAHLGVMENTVKTIFHEKNNG